MTRSCENTSTKNRELLLFFFLSTLTTRNYNGNVYEYACPTRVTRNVAVVPRSASHSEKKRKKKNPLEKQKKNFFNAGGRVCFRHGHRTVIDLPMDFVGYHGSMNNAYRTVTAVHGILIIVLSAY